MLPIWDTWNRLIIGVNYQLQHILTSLAEMVWNNMFLTLK